LSSQSGKKSTAEWSPAGGQRKKPGRLLVTGASGFLGWNICRVMRGRWDIFGTFFTHQVQIPGVTTIQIDLTDYGDLKNAFQEIRPDGVIHAAAAASPNYCQEHRSDAEKINVRASVNIAGLCADSGIPLAFTSTDLVFDGLNAPYDESSPVSPVNIYGEQKVRAEEGVQGAYPHAAVCRMPLMFGYPGPAASNFFVTMTDALKNGKALKLFSDEFRTPVNGTAAAEGLVMMLEKGRGILHMGGRERISRFHFGLLLMDAMNISQAQIIRCSQTDLKMAAPRAPDLSLDSAKAFALGYAPGPLKEQIKKALETAPASDGVL